MVLVQFIRALIGTAIAGFFATASLFAHPSPNSAVALDFLRNGVSAEITLPLAELELSFKKPLLATPDEALEKNRIELADYLVSHIKPESEDGRSWTVSVKQMELKLKEQPYDLVAKVWMQPPTGESPRKFNFNYSVINHEVMSHWVMISVRNDWNTAVFSSKPVPLGTIHYLVTSLKIDRTQGSWFRGFRSVFMLGIYHIAEGTDHLLFLLALLLPAPLLAAGTSWGKYRGLKATLLQLFKIVSAFTLGHSLTLLIGALGVIHYRESPIEVLIAVSIFVSALHALKPWFAGREVWIAGGFGLIHGLAFASSLSEFNFSRWSMASTVLGFNLGIEAMQLAVVVVTIPWLILLSRTSFYSPVRITGALFAGVASLGWIGERTFHLKNPIDGYVSRLAAHPFWLVGALAGAAILATGWQAVAEAPLLDDSECKSQPLALNNQNQILNEK